MELKIKKIKKKYFSSELCFVRWCLMNLPPLLVRLQTGFDLVLLDAFLFDSVFSKLALFFKFVSVFLFDSIFFQFGSVWFFRFQLYKIEIELN